mgnify:CR=1 FL=1
MPTLNEKWAGEVLGMEWHLAGVDLTSNKSIVEVKFSLPKEVGWTVLEYQMSYPNNYPNRNAYWALGVYTLSIPVSKIKYSEEEKLERLVSMRELWIVPWEWMFQFPSSETSGKTKLSEWNNILRYPKKNKIPETEETHKVERGLVHLTKGVPLGDICPV